MGDEPGWNAVSLDDVEAVRWRGTELVWRPVRGALGTRIVGMGGFTAQRVGQEVVEGHRELDGRGHEEVYVVVRGRATFTLDGIELDAPAGTFVAVRDPAVHRRAVAAEPDTAVLALGGPPAFEPSSSEWIERARPFLRSDPARAVRILGQRRPAAPDAASAGILDAFLAIARGDEAAARAALAAAVEHSPDVRPALAEDPDLAPLLGGAADAGAKP